ncbi:hypothetical protein BD769DRAFT_1385101 [Suillus cothurnatus]|nr:hypothetical protein BD769DRAFT_1385101 [Suillus cothurnatus]
MSLAISEAAFLEEWNPWCQLVVSWLSTSSVTVNSNMTGTAQDMGCVVGFVTADFGGAGCSWSGSGSKWSINNDINSIFVEHNCRANVITWQDSIWRKYWLSEGGCGSESMGRLCSGDQCSASKQYFRHASSQTRRRDQRRWYYVELIGYPGPGDLFLGDLDTCVMFNDMENAVDNEDGITAAFLHGDTMKIWQASRPGPPAQTQACSSRIFS